MRLCRELAGPRPTRKLFTETSLSSREGESSLLLVPVTAGNIYYLAIDGYGSECGVYQLDVSILLPEVLECPDAASASTSAGPAARTWSAACPTATRTGTSSRSPEESTITFECSANFYFRNLLVDASLGCDAPTVLADVDGFPYPNVSTITWTCPAGDYWYWVGPQGFTGVECGALYAFSVEGYSAAPVAVTRASWGGLKARYR
jgi:hypothetical protein